jgi:branched-chain amino acid transport system permease protein
MDKAAGPDGQGMMQRYVLAGVLGVIALAYPLLTAGSPVYQRLGALVLLAAIGGSAWNLVGGYAGQISVGHSVFFGAGAYAAIAGYTHFGLPPIAGAPVGALVAVLIAAAIGVPTLRLSGHYFSMATIAVAELARVLIVNWEWVGGAQGISGPAVPRTVLDLSFTSALPYYYIFLLTLGAILFATWRIEHSRMGFYLRAIKDSERAARSLGVAAGRYKLYAYMLSAGLTAVAGSLYATMFGFVDPESGFGILISVKMLIIAALGGAGFLFGPLVGALILVPLEEISNSMLGGRGAGLTFVVYGAIIVIIARFLPSGLLTLFAKHPRQAKIKAEQANAA